MIVARQVGFAEQLRFIAVLGARLPLGTAPQARAIFQQTESVGLPMAASCVEGQASETVVPPAASAGAHPSSVEQGVKPALGTVRRPQATSPRTERVAVMARPAPGLGSATVARQTASAATPRTTVRPVVDQALVLAKGQAMFRPMAGAAVMERRAPDQLSAPAAPQADSVARPATTVGLGVNPALERAAIPALAASRLMDGAVATEKHAPGRPLAPAALRVDSVARLTTTAVQAARLDLEPVAAALVLSRPTDSAVPTGRRVLGRPLAPAAPRATFAAQPASTAVRAARLNLAPAVAVLVVFRPMGSGAVMARPVPGQPLERVAPRAAFAEARLSTAVLGASPVLVRAAAVLVAFQPMGGAAVTVRRAWDRPLGRVVLAVDFVETRRTIADRDGRCSFPRLRSTLKVANESISQRSFSNSCITTNIPSVDGSCGASKGGFTCNGGDFNNQCCSAGGFCGTTSGHCASGW